MFDGLLLKNQETILIKRSPTIKAYMSLSLNQKSCKYQKKTISCFKLKAWTSLIWIEYTNTQTTSHL